MPVEVDGYVHFGPLANCTFEVCRVEESVYGYRMSLPANIIFLTLFSIAGIVHLCLGIRLKSWWFMWCVLITCIHEVLGYAARIMMYNNPWSFTAFMINIITITQAPVFYCAAIYVTLAQTINHFAPTLARFPPSLLYWVFIPCDVISLALQGTGGGMTADSSARNKAGLQITRAGLIFQVITLFTFLVLSADFLIRLQRLGGMKKTSKEEKHFFIFIGLAAWLTFVRCLYRVAELKDGYSGKLFQDEVLFIVLEGTLVVLSVFCLCIGHPGRVFNKREQNDGEGLANRSGDESSTSARKPKLDG